jgi:two-component system, LuxR family, response regulator FixJ
VSQIVHVIDDDEAVRDSLAALLESAGYAVLTYPSAEAFLAKAPASDQACALVDLRLPGMDGIALIERLAATDRLLPAIMVTGHGDVPLAVRTMRAGAVDFVEKPYAGFAILESVRRALARPTESAPGDDHPSDAITERVAALTPREREVLDLLVAGHPNKVIAYTLHISPRTVEIHRANLMKKMQARSLPALIRMAIKAGVGSG